MADVTAFFQTAPVARLIKWDGKEQEFWFKRITGAQRMQLTSGQRISVGRDSNQMEVDLGDVTRRQHMLVHFSVCNETGERQFRTLEDVKALPSTAIALLFRAAEEVNKEDEDAGKS